MSSWFDLWPTWSSRWFGWVLRLLLGVVGGLFGFFLIVLASFGATYEQRSPEWGGEEVLFLGFGVLILCASLWVIARPARASLLLLGLSVGGVLLAGAAV